MDLSKLPRLSNTEAAQSEPQPGQPAPPAAAGGGPASPLPPADPPPFVQASAWCPNCGAPLMTGSRFCNSCGVQLGAARIRGTGESGAALEALISIGLGLFLLFMAPRFVQWASSRLFGTHFDEFGFKEEQVNAETGLAEEVTRTVPYHTVPEFWMDLGPAAFALVLILDGIVLALLRRKIPILITFVLTLVATGYNLVYVFATFASQGFAPFSFLAVLFGGMMLFYQWQVFQSLRERVAPAPVMQRPA